MKIHFMGTAGSAPVKGRSNLSLLLQGDSGSVLVDCSGSPASKILDFGVSVNDLHEVFLTHHHIDHVYALPSLLHNLWLDNGFSDNKRMCFLGLPETLKFAKKLVALFEIEQKKHAVRIEWKEISQEQGQELEFNALKDQILSFPVTHGEIPTVGFRITTKSGLCLAFGSDCIVDDLLDRLVPAQADYLIADCGGGKYSSTGHAGVIDIAKFANEKKVANLYLTHLPQTEVIDETNIAVEAKKYFDGNVVIAKDGSCIDLN